MIGLIFFHLAAFGCRTFKLTYSSDDDVFDSEAFHFGFWTYYEAGACISFPSEVISEFTGYFKFGRAAGVVGSLLIWAIVVVVIMASFFRFPQPKIVFRVIGGCMGLVAVFSGLLLLGLRDEDDLELGVGSILAIVSAAIWVGGAASMVFGMNERQGVKSNATTPVIAAKGSTSNSATKQDAPEFTDTDNGNDDDV